ncbi:MAG: ABC transporter substrate-binding protein, partial [Halocynthiibacter sp.]
MRYPFISLGLGFLASFVAPMAQGFEIESETFYEVAAPAREINIISTADKDVFAPVLLAFQAENPGVSVRYTVVSSTELMTAIETEGVPFDIALSSAMDLQTKLANDGYTQPYRSAATAALPDWAKWRDHIFSFTREPATIVVSTSAFEGLEVPKNRQGLIALLRENADRFQGRVGTYDVRQSGLGYLFATQDSRSSEIYWRLTEVMGRLGTRLYCCSSDMIRDVSEGRIAVAYNVLGSYA